MDVRMSLMTVPLIAAVLVSPCVNAQTSSGEALKLDEALSIARSNNRALKQSGLEIGKQTEALSEAKTQFYPRFDATVLAAQLLAPLNFTINTGQFGTFPGTGPIPGSNTNLHTPARPIAIASVTATQPLTQLFRIHLFVSEQRLKLDAARLSFNEDDQKLTDEVRQIYFEVLQSQSQHESQESMVKYLKELQQLTERRFEQEASLKADKLSVKAELAKALYQLTTIEDILADRKESLNHLLGRNLQAECSLESLPATLPEEGDLTAARALPLEHRPHPHHAPTPFTQPNLP